MKIRIIQKTPYKDGFLMPGDYADVDAKLAEKWIEQGNAVVPVEDKKEVKHGNRQNSSKVV